MVHVLTDESGAKRRAAPNQRQILWRITRRLIVSQQRLIHPPVGLRSDTALQRSLRALGVDAHHARRLPRRRALRSEWHRTAQQQTQQKSRSLAGEQRFHNLRTSQLGASILREPPLKPQPA